ncbi:Bcr/CflA family drug resistance efflux transporter [Bacillus sp. FJAT-27225]|uniref:Bcr/CflA family efflux MFS transporter n=1 Tax=Bacillus sp. FJAT-27225 TaxID=1743144 RepID=UPI00080C357C|nr:Bcr/CflA family efflux MFS transporter [Bacillus sp. FJAT-27225]OCA87708.1 Bcr/CflA family drug resistance efflux transporter [Bacillus sp. FJAT-27225]
MVKNPTGRQRIGLAFLLSMLSILGPLNIDMYLPSFPEIAEVFGAEASLVQLSLTACLLGIAIGQLIVGPISDSKGRRKPLLISVFLFGLSSLFCAFAPTIEMLIVGRFLQGLTASGGIVLSRAIVRDIFDGEALTKFYSLLMVITTVAPLVAPIAGGLILLLPFGNWSMIFVFLSLIGFVILAVVGIKLKETLPVEERTASSIGGTLRAMGGLVKDRSFIGYALIVGFVHGGSFAYVSGTPFVYQGIYGVSPQTFSILFGINGIALISGSYIAGRFSGRERGLLRTAVLTALTATAFLLIMTMIKGPLATLVISIYIYMTAMGMILTSSFSLAMEKQGRRAGSASAFLGMLPLLIGSAVSPLVGLDETTAVPLGVILFTTTLIGNISFFGLTRKPETENKIIG